MKVDDIYLPCPTVHQIAQINQILTGERRVRSPELLDSAAHQPYQTFGGADLYPTPFDKAAALIRSIAENQPFVDGNKPTAWLAGRVLLRANGVRIRATTDEIVAVMTGFASKKVSVEDIADFLLEHATSAPVITETSQTGQ